MLDIRDFNTSFNHISRCGSRTAATSKIELIVIIVNGFQPLTIITKCSIFGVTAVLDPCLNAVVKNTHNFLCQILINHL